MNIFTIKMIAIITMIIDHIGVFFFPDILLLRYIGRLSFPLFAWLIANGAIHSKNSITYAKRLFILAIISQIPYVYANRLVDPRFIQLNVVFTLFLGLSSIIVIQKYKQKLYWLLSIVIAAVLSIIFQTDYGVLGVLLIVSCYFFYNNLKKMTVAFFVLLLLPLINLSPYYLYSNYEFFGIISLLFIYLYNKREGYKNKYIFYYFYPLQYIVFIFCKLYLKF